MQLIYRDHCYLYSPTTTQSTRPPRAINWRYCLPGIDPGEILPVDLSTPDRAILPRAINWRYQIRTEV